ncbi:TetR family transcriptional regulator [Haloactinospora alba]|uniref:TetR family transcriptional regulator n=1 Tax=Haloactinospora alba TaxID=405555 RepID=A0A543N7P2_9ACTN|nr:TetR/AcrR family transcriptional regulator [Haloactinospora alba]TQN27843.1 TetR family transcriptional regulator [Haloactinospora alba]
MADTRERILDAAARVLREQGLSRTTTKRIARESGFSEANLYKRFRDKNELLLAVLTERGGPFGHIVAGARDRAGTGTVRRNLEEIAAAALDFYTEAVPTGGAIFADPQLFSAFRDHLAERGLGPHVPRDLVAAYLRDERELGRLRADTDAHATAALLLGACFQQAFLSHFTAEPRAADADRDTAAALVRTLLGPLLPPE